MYSLEPVNLKERILLGRNALLGGLDPSQDYAPYWNCGWADGELTAFGHSGSWDKCHNAGRAIHALCAVEDVTGEKVPPDVLNSLSKYLYGLFDGDDDLPGTASDETGARFVHLHNVRENLHGLNALIKRGDTKASELARKMVRKMLTLVDRDGVIQLDKFPGTVQQPYTWQSEQEGRALDALVRYYRVSDDAAGMELASRIVKFAVDKCYTPDGYLTELAGTHGHSVCAMLAGLCDYALLTSDGEFAALARRVFDNGLPRFNSSFGWSMESLHVYTCDSYSETKGLITRGESNNTGDILRAAVLLGQLGYRKHFGIAERILRSHLLPSQLVDTDGLSDADNADDGKRRMASRIRGGFSFPTPNDLLYDSSCPIFTYDITSGAVDGMCEAYGAIVTGDEMGFRVNMHLDYSDPQVQVKTSLPLTGITRVSAMSRPALLIAKPSSASDVNVIVDGKACEARQMPRYWFFGNCDKGIEVTLEFTPARNRTHESIAYKKHTIDWVGEQIVAMSPAGKYMPFFAPVRDEP